MVAVTFARATEAQLTSTLGSSSFDPLLAFRTPLEGYNVLIRLNHGFVRRRRQAIDYVKVGCFSLVNGLFDCLDPLTNKQPKATSKKHKFKNLEPAPAPAAKPMPGFDPVTMFVSELRQRFGRVGLFFYDTYGGDTIGVVWQPKVGVYSQRSSIAHVHFSLFPSPTEAWRSEFQHFSFMSQPTSQGQAGACLCRVCDVSVAHPNNTALRDTKCWECRCWDGITRRGAGG